MEAKVWFGVVNPRSPWTKVSLEGIADVDDLKEAIKKKMSPMLDGYAAVDLMIKAKKGDKNNTHAMELDAEDDLASILRCFAIEGLPSIQAAFAGGVRLFAYVPSSK